MALCTQADIETRLQIEFTADPEQVITDLIADAQSHIESYVGRALESDNYEETFDPWRAALYLKHWPVTTLTSVTVEGVAVDVGETVSYPSGRVVRYRNGFRIGWGSTTPRSVVVVYTGGYLSPDHDPELTHLGSICVEVVARALRLAADWVATPAGAGDIQSVSLTGSDTISYATGAGQIGRIPAEAAGRFMSLLDSERFELDPYRGLPVA